ncbi:MAG: phage tail protein [Ilumatobacteraceae bacterium]
MPVTTPGPVKDEEYIGSWFGVELDNGIKGAFTDVSGLSIDVGVVEVKVSTPAGDTMIRKRPGTTVYQDITLKRTFSGDKKFWEWAKKIRDGGAEFRTNGAIALYDIAGGEVGRWSFTNAWPSKWSASDLDVGSDDVMVEEVVLAIEFLKRES